MITRRTVLAAPLFAGLAQTLNAQMENSRMLLAIHQNTSRAAGFRGSLEGYASAGIQYVELNSILLDEFLQTDTLSGARQLLTDLNLIPVSGAVTLHDIWLPGPERQNSLDTWRHRCEQFVELGLEKAYSPSVTRRPVTVEDFAATPDCIHEVGEITAEFGLTAMIEFTRTSSHLSTLTSALQVIRAAEHPNVKPMLDFFHFWSGLSKFEDLDLLQHGELAHAHFQDLLDTPKELINNDSRIIPGDGIAPIERILRKLSEKGYEGALSVELFREEIVNANPSQMASEIREKCENVMREADVL